jgi:L-arabinose isomerase
MIDLKRMEVWFVTGSQHLYGPEILKQVAAHSREIAGALDAASASPVKVRFKPIVKTPEEVFALFQQIRRPDVSDW